MATFKLKEAIAYAKGNGAIKKSDLALELWKDSSLSTARANFSNLITGRTKKVDIESIPLLCSRLGVSADFLFGITTSPNNEGIKSEIDKIVTRLDGITTDLEAIENNL